MLFLKKAESLAVALRSLFQHGRVRADVYELRLAICADCDKRVIAKRRSYCVECGCPQWYLSRLEVKARMLEIKCPLDKWKRRKMVRAKFRVSNIRTYSDDPNGLKTIVLHAVYDDGIPENQRFAQATPSGAIEITINNPPASDVFKHGQEFYIDFTPIENAAE